MPIGPNGEIRPADTVQAAVMVMKIATGEIEEDYITPPNEDRQKGGKARAEKLSAERRSEIARNAAKARWAEPKRPT